MAAMRPEQPTSCLEQQQQECGRRSHVAWQDPCSNKPMPRQRCCGQHGPTLSDADTTGDDTPREVDPLLAASSPLVAATWTDRVAYNLSLEVNL